jgi:hypothetical protein
VLLTQQEIQTDLLLQLLPIVLLLKITNVEVTVVEIIICKILQITEVITTFPVITNQEQIQGLPIIRTEQVNQPVIPAQPRTEVQFLIAVRLKAILNRATKYLQQIQDQAREVQAALIAQVRQALQLLRKVILQEVHLLQETHHHQEVILPRALHQREVVPVVHIHQAVAVTAQVEAVVTAQEAAATAQEAVVQVEVAVVLVVVHHQGAEDNNWKQ